MLWKGRIKDVMGKKIRHKRRRTGGKEEENNYQSLHILKPHSHKETTFGEHAMPVK